MSDYDYLNARVRAMGASLLASGLFDQILQAEGEEIMVDVLQNSAYARDLSEALAAGQGPNAVEAALRRRLFKTLDKVRSIAPPGPAKLVEIQLNRWDVDNIVAILRGMLSRSPLEEVVASLVPAGQYSPAQLAELAGEPDPPALADSLTSWGYALAPSMRRAIRANGPDGDQAALEAALYLEYFSYAFSRIDAADPNEAVLRSLLRLQVDLLNVVAVLKRVEQRSLGTAAPAAEPLPGGGLDKSLLDRLAAAAKVEDALEVLARTDFAPGVERGILAFGQTNRLSALERFLEIVVIERGIRLFRGDPLSAAVPLGFIWRAVNEYRNLRMLLRGKRYHMPVNAIKEALVLV